MYNSPRVVMVVVNEEKRRWREIKDEAGTKITTRERRPTPPSLSCPIPEFLTSLHPRRATPHLSPWVSPSAMYLLPLFFLTHSYLSFFTLSLSFFISLLPLSLSLTLFLHLTLFLIPSLSHTLYFTSLSVHRTGR